MSVTIPPGVSSDGMVKVAFVPTLADPNAPTLTEINAPTALPNLDVYLTRTGFAPGATVADVVDERLASKQTYARVGTVQYTLGDLTYVYDPQNPESDTNKAYATLTPYLTGYLVAAWGKDAGEAWAASDVVDVIPVELGPQVKQAPEANSTLKVAQAARVIGGVVSDVTLAA